MFRKVSLFLTLVLVIGALSACAGLGLGQSESDSNFADDAVLVILTNEASLSLKEYTVADFPEIPCSTVVDLSSATGKIVRVKLTGGDASELGMEDLERAQSILDNFDLTTYKKIYLLKLKKPGTKNVLKAIELLKARDDVYFAEPNYVISFD